MSAKTPDPRTVELGGYVFIDGKAHLDKCYLCGESREAVKYSQRNRNPIYCATVSSGEWGTEVDQEYDHHVFVLTEKAYRADLATEKDYLDYLNDYTDFMDAELSQKTGDAN